MLQDLLQSFSNDISTCFFQKAINSIRLSCRPSKSSRQDKSFNFFLTLSLGGDEVVVRTYRSTSASLFLFRKFVIEAARLLSRYRSTHTHKLNICRAMSYRLTDVHGPLIKKKLWKRAIKAERKRLLKPTRNSHPTNIEWRAHFW